jgi:hypothetical protein
MASRNLNSLLDKLKYENKEVSSFNILKEENKDLAKEDSLALIAEFVKDIKKKFENKDDQLEVLRDASKTLEFYINEIMNTSSVRSIDTSSIIDRGPKSFDTSSYDDSNEIDLDEF